MSGIAMLGICCKAPFVGNTWKVDFAAIHCAMLKRERLDTPEYLSEAWTGFVESPDHDKRGH